MPDIFPQTIDYAPDWNVEIEETPRVREAKMGDGYSIRAQDGINPIEQSVPMRWSNRSAVVADVIVGFLRLQGGYKAFYFTPPGEEQGLYTCASWRRTKVDVNVETVTATFIKRYDLVTG